MFQKGCRSGTRYLTLLARENHTSGARLGLAIARKQIKTAVGRNRVKRQVRESFRHHQDLLAGLDIVVMARPGIATADTRKIRSALDSQWRELAKRCKKS